MSLWFSDITDGLSVTFTADNSDTRLMAVHRISDEFASRFAAKYKKDAKEFVDGIVIPVCKRYREDQDTKPGVQFAYISRTERFMQGLSGMVTPHAGKFGFNCTLTSANPNTSLAQVTVTIKWPTETASAVCGGVGTSAHQE